MATRDNRLAEAERFLLHEGKESIKGRVEMFEKLWLPKNSTDAKQCGRICKILSDYSKRDDPPRPLSIAMFGPPGSGKSFTVEQLTAHAKGYEKEPETINLSQLDGPGQLAECLLRSLSSRGTKTPVILFDEFDTALNGDDLGWLRWFLAPMQDAVFFHKGQACAIPQAAFFFAGGTAEKFEDFQARHAAYFVQRKGPDFISRLRGTMDIEGVNTFDSECMLRRSLVLQHLLKKRNKNLVDERKGDTLRIQDTVLHKLLDGGYYKHGARSMEAILDMCRLTHLSENGEFTETHLPAPAWLKLHVSRGPLHDRTIGFSAGLYSSPADSLITRLAETLVNQGATLAYCASLGPTLDIILGAAEGLTDPLAGDDPDHRIWHPVAFPAYLEPNYWEKRSEKIKNHTLFDEMQTLSVDEFRKFGLPSKYFRPLPRGKRGRYNVKWHVAWALSLFRMRVRLIQGVDALVVIGGKGGHEPELKYDKNGKITREKRDTADTLPWGRFPGVAEEVMLALAFKKPVYVLGMLQGAAKDIGNLLGLSRTQLCSSSCLPKPRGDNFAEFEDALDAESRSFKIPHKDGLPLDFDSLREFFRDRALGSSDWPWNALTPDENRLLFNARRRKKEIDTCVRLILRGIRHPDWAKSDRSPAEHKCCHECGQPMKTPTANS